MYAFNYEKNKVIWAKNYETPFSSNIKILKNKIVVVNQDNYLYIIKKQDGDLLKLIPTEETLVKNNFKNNLSLNKKDDLFFLNTFGSLYKIDSKNLTINWFNNFSQSLDQLEQSLFFGSVIVNSNKEIIISSNNKTFIIDNLSGSVLKSFNFSAAVKPIIINNTVLFVTKNNFLIALNLSTKNIIYSIDISKIDEIKLDWLKDKNFHELMILNNEIFIFLKNNRVLNFEINGKFKGLQKLPSEINTLPIAINNSILYLNNKNNLIILN